LIGGNSLSNIIKEQYHLSSKANISVLESNLMADFEREAFLIMVLKEAEKLAEK
jgi:hypothetical protein